MGAGLGLGTSYNSLIHTSTAICKLNLALTTCELGVTCVMCFVVIAVIFHDPGLVCVEKPLSISALIANIDDLASSISNRLDVAISTI